MRIGVVSDTHMFGRAKQLPPTLLEGLKGVDLILHAGDWVDPRVVELFEQIAPTDGVAGNNDGLDIIERFGRQKVLNLSGYRIGLVHGDGGRKSTLDRSVDAFRDMSVDVIVFGHSHVPYRGMHNGTLLFNPGSPTDKRRQPQYSYGIMELGSTLEAALYYYD
ncbi:metallophosphoesterase family protein [Paenibacillus sp. UNC451MF]|uniref:metallophosphoesterase family protein n=1 Tax=Paenibacillus sp. UNC451MF TaxID=1449063 RepID=UPI00048F10AD|nr:metallophosphoesterase family protein [Paenibacillus sp. UNC451MF]